MKKILALLLALMLILSLSLVACDEALADEDESKSSDNVSAEKDKDDDQEIAEEDKVDFDKEDEDEEDDFVIEFYPESEEKESEEQESKKDTETEGDFSDLDDETASAQIVKDPAIIEKYKAELERHANEECGTTVLYQNTEMTMTYNGETIEQSMVLYGVRMVDGDNYSSVVQMVSEGEISNTENLQYVDGIIYVVQAVDGRKVKAVATKEQAKAIINEGDEEFDWFDESVQNAEIFKTDEGYYVDLTLTSGGDQIQSLFTDAFPPEVVKDINNVSLYVLFDTDMNIEAVSMSATFYMDVEGIETVVVMDYVIEFTDVGTTVVKAPDDKDSYELVSYDMIDNTK